jgi:hypothetical protein
VFKKVFYALAFTIAIPAFGLLVALWILGQYHDEVRWKCGGARYINSL